MKVEVPIVPDLARELETVSKKQMLFLQTELGKAFSVAGFGNRFREWCDEAGLRHCSAHGLRKRMASLLAENGASGAEITAVLGHSSVQQSEPYLKKMNRKKLARSAMEKVK